MRSKYKKFIVLTIVLFAFSSIALATKLSKKSEVKVQFSECPENPSSDFVFKTSKIFESSGRSLKDVKSYIKENRYKEKYFLSDYKIKYNPIKRELSYFLTCSEPILKVSALDDKGNLAYSIVLSEDGMSHDPSYLVYLKSSGKDKSIAKAALPVSLLTQDNKEELVLLARKIRNLSKVSLREMIYSQDGEMTMIIGRDKKITSVFLGGGFWGKKLEKLNKIMGYMGTKKKTPTRINLTDVNKIVIKF